MNYTGIILTCLATNVITSNIKLKWYKDLRELRSSNFTRINGHAMAGLYFRNGFQPTDVGHYFCAMEGPVMSKTESFTLRAGDSRITMQSCRSRSGTTVKIRVHGVLCYDYFTSRQHTTLSQFLHSILSLLYVKCGSCAESVTFDKEPTCNNATTLFEGMVFSEAAFCALSSVQQTGSAIAINGRLHFIDRQCALMGAECSLGGVAASTSTVRGSAIAIGLVIVIGTTAVCTIFVAQCVRANIRYAMIAAHF